MILLLKAVALVQTCINRIRSVTPLQIELKAVYQVSQLLKYFQIFVLHTYKFIFKWRSENKSARIPWKFNHSAKSFSHVCVCLRPSYEIHLIYIQFKLFKLKVFLRWHVEKLQFFYVERSQNITQIKTGQNCQFWYLIF